jgi:hypothetical protein
VDLGCWLLVGGWSRGFVSVVLLSLLFPASRTGSYGLSRCSAGPARPRQPPSTVNVLRRGKCCPFFRGAFSGPVSSLTFFTTALGEMLSVFLRRAFLDRFVPNFSATALGEMLSVFFPLCVFARSKTQMLRTALENTNVANHTREHECCEPRSRTQMLQNASHCRRLRKRFALPPPTHN